MNYKAKTDKDTLPEVRYLYLNEFRQLRAGDYHTVLRRFVKPLVGAYTWNNRIRDIHLDPEKLCTPSDEAFAILALENNYLRWLDIFEKNNHEVPRPERQEGDRKKKCVSNVKPAFTTGGNVYDEPSPDELSHQKTKGWSKEGIARFNELHRMIVADRKEHPDCLRDFIRTERLCLGQQERGRPAAAKTKSILEAVQDDFSDDENPDDNGPEEIPV